LYGDKLYWAEEGRLARADPDGDSIETVIDFGRPRSVAVSVWVGHRKVYWTDSDANALQRTDVSWTMPELLASGLQHPVDIEINYFEDKLYFTEFNSGKIMKCNYDGSDVEEVVTGLGGPHGLEMLIYQGFGIEDPIICNVYPNPLQEEASFVYTLENKSLVNLFITDSKGIIATQLIDQYQAAGRHEYRWNTANHPPGIYFYHLMVNNKTSNGKILVLK